MYFFLRLFNYLNVYLNDLQLEKNQKIEEPSQT